MASKGFVTITRMQFGEYLTNCSVAVRTTSKFAIRRSSRLMPGLRGKPAVMMARSEPAVGS
jgi:hypothetical protein